MGALDGQVAIVTGAGRGIGLAIARALGGAGAAVALAARTSAEVEAAAREITAAGGRARAHPADVTRPDAVDALVAATLEAWGRVDVLVAAAGVATFGPVATGAPGDWDTMLAVNLRGTMLACRAVLAPMRRQGRGTIVTLASVAATRAIPGGAAYAASKAGVLAWTRVLAEEVRADGIRVGALLPGATDTPLWDAVPAAPDRARMLRPEEVARAALLMVSLPPSAALEELTLLPAGGIL